MAERIYSVGIYARLSVEGGDRKNESVETQIEIAKEYMKGREDMVLYGCYTDLGKTGTNFERQGFGRLMADVRSRRVDCVIVKDFSRFGRNYIETGNFIQRIFPFLGVRFVSVTDGFDSLFAEKDDLWVNLKNLANEMYARDIALKVKSAKRAKREDGSYVGGMPPYGCRAEWVDGKRCLFAEAGTAEIVKDIFRQYDEGRKLKEVAAELYEKGIHRPTEYHRYHHLWRQPGETLREWPRSSIKTMLTNAVYVHAGIVGREQFCRIARKFEERAEKTKEREGNEKRADTFFGKNMAKEDIFDGILFCGCCGKRLGRREISKRSGTGHETGSFVYFCRNSATIDELRCGSGVISGIELTDMVEAVLRQEVDFHHIMPEGPVRENMKYAAEQERRIKKNSQAIQRKLKCAEWAASERYRQYREGVISREAFLEWRAQNRKETEKAGEMLQKADRKISELKAEAERQNDLLRGMTEFSGDVKPEGALISTLIERINLYPGKRVEIIFRFKPGIPPDKSWADKSKADRSKADISKAGNGSE